MKNITKIALVAILAVSVSVVSVQGNKARAADCSNPASVLDARIVSTGEFGGGALAVVTNNSDCSFNVGIDAYQTSNNFHYDWKGTVVGPRQTTELHINVPDCQYRLELSTDSTILASQTVRSNACGAVAQSVSISFHVHANCIGENIANATVVAGSVSGTTDGGGNVTLSAPANTTVSWNASANGYNSASGALATGNGASQDVTLTRQCAGPTATPVPPTPVPPTPVPPTPVPPTPVPTYTPIPVPTYVPTPLNPVNFNFNAPCTGNGSTFSNSCNTTTTNTVNNTSNITQNGNGNNAQVNQSGAAGGNYSGTQQNLYLPWVVSAAIAPAPAQNAYLSISKMVRNISSNTSEVKSVNANVNDTVEFVIRVSAPNGQTANNVRVTDSLPAGLNYVNGSTTVDNAYMNDGVTSSGLNLGSFYSGRLATIRFRATVSQNGTQYGYNNTYSTTLTNSATVYADNATSATDSASVMVTSYVVPQPTQQVLSISKSARNITRGDTTPRTSLTARAGDGIEFTLIVTAPYNTSLNNVVIADALPAGMTYTVGSTTLNNNRTNDGLVSGGINIGSLSSGQTATIVFYATVNPGVGAGQVLVNTGSVRADNVNPMTSNPVSITIGNYSVIAGGLHVQTGPTGDAFAIAGLGAILTSAIYVGKRKGFAALINLA